MGRISPLPRHRSPEQISSRPSLTNRTGGYPRGTNRMNHYVEESLDDVVHHVPGLDHAIPPTGRRFCEAFGEEEYMSIVNNSTGDGDVCADVGGAVGLPGLAGFPREGVGIDGS